MTRKWTKDYDESDADIRVDANGTVSTQCPSSQDKELLLVCREESTVLQEGAAPTSPSFLVQNPKPTAGGWALGVLGLIVLVAVTPVARGGTARALKEPQVAITDAADWIGMLPQDVVSHLDTQVNPCDDLYAFSCGSWLKQAEVPDDGARVSLFYSQVIDENREVLKEVMEQGWPLVGELYESCMNFSDTSCKTDDETSVAILSPTIAQIAATTSKSDFFRLAGTVSKTGPSFLTEIGVGPDAREVTVLTLHASQTGISLPDPQYYLDPKQFGSIRDAFHAYIVKLFTLVGYEPHVAALQASSVIDFEQALASLFVPREKLQDPVASYNRMSVAQASEKYPLLLGQTMNGRGTLATLLARNASLIVTTPTFFERAERFVSGDAVTLDALKAVLTYRYIGAWANLLSESFVQARFSFFQQTLQGQNTREARWMFCLQSVYSFFPDLTGKYFALRRFDEATEQLAKQFVTRIQASLQRDLTQVDWLDGPTRQAALEKLGNMTNLIGYSNLSDFPYELRSDAPFIENVQAIMEDMFERGVAQIGGRVDRSKWAVSGAEVNAFYQPTANRMVFPAGILQPPFFARDQHPARNFGAIGHIIGHELTHGFDASGRLFAFDGNLQDWWSNATATEFLHRADCLVRQYNAFAVTISSNRDKVLGYVNGQLTLSENIADTGGMKLAYHAYQTYVADRSKAPSNVNDGESTSTSTSQAEHSLPADVADKLFFIAFAQGHCSKWSDAATAEKLLTDPHSPGQWRANGVASNSHDFARVFSCPAGSPMNPTTKCQLW